MKLQMSEVGVSSNLDPVSRDLRASLFSSLSLRHIIGPADSSPLISVPRLLVECHLAD
jgi:hypothetical protein